MSGEGPGSARRIRGVTSARISSAFRYCARERSAPDVKIDLRPARRRALKEYSLDTTTGGSSRVPERGSETVHCLGTHTEMTAPKLDWHEIQSRAALNELGGFRMRLNEDGTEDVRALPADLNQGNRR